MANEPNSRPEFIDQKEEKKEYRRSRFRDVVDGSLLTRDKVVKQLPFVLFLTLTIILYIANRYHAEKLVRRTLEMQTELKELRAESISTASGLEYISRQSQVARLIDERNMDLKQSEKPPYQLVDEKKRRRRNDD
ncbi:MAG: hypothetical protein ISS19_11575 [Bacteroidales bacterium]|nr:hypothetical protein [Bacteroidales bacterium]